MKLQLNLLMLRVMIFSVYSLNSMEPMNLQKPSSSEKGVAVKLHAFYELCEIMKAGDEKKAQRFIENDPGLLFIQDGHKKTILHKAIESSNVSFALWIIYEREGVNDEQDETGSTPLHAAIELGDTDSAVALINKGCKRDLTNNRGQSPLHVALRKNNEIVAQTLIENGASLVLADSGGNTPFHVAAESKKGSMLSTFIVNEVPLTLLNKEYMNPLDCGIRNGNVENTLQLLDYAYILGLFSTLAAPALFTAIEANNIDIVRKLLELDKNLVYCTDSAELTPLHVAVKKKLSIVELLLEKGASLNALTPDGKSPLFSAIEGSIEKSDVAEYLIRYYSENPPLSDCCFLEFPDKTGVTPLQQAITRGSSSIVDLLLRYGCSPSSCNVLGNTPLHMASTSGYAKIVKQLLLAGADAEVYNALGSTPLHCAAAGDNAACCQALISRPDIFDKLLNAEMFNRRIFTAFCCLRR